MTIPAVKSVHKRFERMCNELPLLYEEPRLPTVAELWVLLVKGMLECELRCPSSASYRLPRDPAWWMDVARFSRRKLRRFLNSMVQGCSGDWRESTRISTWRVSIDVVRAEEHPRRRGKLYICYQGGDRVEAIWSSHIREANRTGWIGAYGERQDRPFFAGYSEDIVVPKGLYVLDTKSDGCSARVEVDIELTNKKRRR